MTKKNEWVPWYRRKGYRGNLTEEEKRYLDSFRLEKKHPAATFDELPSEVQSYLMELEQAVYDKKQEGAATKALILNGIGAFMIFTAYRETSWYGPLFGYVLGGAVIAFAWINYPREWKKNAEEDRIDQKGEGVPFSATEEKFQQYWESDAISRFRKRHEQETGDNLG